MSRTKCDRCGKMFKIEVGAMCLDEYGVDMDDEFAVEARCKHDLCLECSDQFRAFMSGGKKE